jgi:hypothetical protein
VLSSIYVWIIYPALIWPKNLQVTDIPSLSISGLNETKELFTTLGKISIEAPEEPDLSSYVFGLTNPIVIPPPINN